MRLPRRPQKWVCPRFGSIIRVQATLKISRPGPISYRRGVRISRMRFSNSSDATGVERVCLLGIRLGSLLATLAAPRCPSVCALIGVAPTLSGRRFVRELKTFELAAAARATAQKAAPLDTKGSSDGSFEANGFILTANTIAALQKVELMELPAPSVADALIIDRDDLAAAKGWSDRLIAAGVATEYTAMSGFVQMLMRPPNLTTVPLHMIAAARDWLGALASKTAPAELSSAQVEAIPAAPGMVLRLENESTISEHTVVLRSDPLLFGIVHGSPNGGGPTQRRDIAEFRLRPAHRAASPVCHHGSRMGQKWLLRIAGGYIRPGRQRGATGSPA